MPARVVALGILIAATVAAQEAPRFTVDLAPRLVERNAAGAVDRVFLAKPVAKAPKVDCTAMSPDGARVATGDRQGGVRVFDAGTGVVLLQAAITDPRRSEITGLAFLDGGRKLLASAGGGTVARFDAASGARESEGRLPSTVSALDVDEERGRLAVGSEDGGVFEHELGSLVRVRTFREEVAGAGAVCLVRYVARGGSLLSATENYEPGKDAESASTTGQEGRRDAGLTQWSTSTGSRERRFDAPAGGVRAVEAAEGLIVATSDRGPSVVFEATGARKLDLYGSDSLARIRAGTSGFIVIERADAFSIAACTTLKELINAGEGALSTKFRGGTLSSSRDAALFAVGLGDGGVAVYRFTPLEAATGSAVREEHLGEPFGISLDVALELTGHRTEVEEIVASASGGFLASRDSDGIVFTWKRNGEAWSGAALPAALGTWDSADRMSIRASDESLLLVLPDGTLQRVSLPTREAGKPIAIAGADAKPVGAQVALDLDAASMLVATTDGGLVVADASGKVSRTVVGPGHGSGFWKLVPVPQWGAVLALPHELREEAPADHNRVALFRTSDWARIAAAGPDLGAPDACLLRGGSQALVSSKWGGRGIFALATGTLQPIARGRRSPEQIAPIGDALVLGVFDLALGVFRVQGEEIEGTLLERRPGVVTTAAAHADPTRAWLGLKGGSILELRAH